jgi:phosphoribosylformylglycinamidine synthase
VLKTNSEVNSEVISSHGLSQEEYERICQALGRSPNLTELGIFSVMWSEHCSYKSSRVHLKKLPTEGPQVIQGPGENAGVVDIGDDLAAVFKIESHNHPSYIEPYQGAATGVGGIIRDIFTMGARPIALMNSLHFGPLENPQNQHIMEGVVAGIGNYGNCMGIPTVGGEVTFAAPYSKNPLVNAFCLGIAPKNKIFYAKATGVGNPVIYVGAKTGRDGIHGATMASEQFEEGAESKRPNVQVGDPFLEKLLLEACLDAMQSGKVIGIQDMGAAGLTCSTCEMGGRSNAGIEIHLDRVPQREQGMSPYEIMLSESQERMLLVCEKGTEGELLSIFDRWELDAVKIGEVKDHGKLIVFDKGEKVAEIPNDVLTEQAPIYNRPSHPGQEDQRTEILLWQGPEPENYNELLFKLAASPQLCSRLWVYRQYDYQVRTNTMMGPGSDAAILRIKEGNGGLGITLDGNPFYCHLNPRLGAMHAVAESCRNLVCSGATPLAATNCLNFASPENPEVMWQFSEAVEGIAEACDFFQTPITGGNVSFYNETDGEGVLPTPVIGMLGRVEDLTKVCSSSFSQSGDEVFLVGAPTRPELGGSAYLQILGEPLLGPIPSLDLDLEKDLQACLKNAIQEGLLNSAHDVSEGGLLTCLVESCLHSDLGIKASFDSHGMRPDHFLMSETASRVVVSVSAKQTPDFEKCLAGVPRTRIGVVTPDHFKIMVDRKQLISTELQHLKTVWLSHFDEVFST